jgi:DNA polymerase-1
VWLLAFHDCETNGLLDGKWVKGVFEPPMDKVHCIAIATFDSDTKQWRRISACDHASYRQGYAYYIPDPQDAAKLTAVHIADPADAPEGMMVWECMNMVDALRYLETADTRVAFNGQDFDEGVMPTRPGAIPRVYPWWKPKEGSKLIDPLLLSRLIYPDIRNSGPNSYKLVPHMRSSHNLKSWGLRLGNHKGDYTGGWERWSEWMQGYMCQDVEVLISVFQWLMSQKPAAESSGIEHEFASIIRRQESRGFGFDYDKAITLLGELKARQQTLEAALIEAFGEWWVWGKAANANAYEPTYNTEEDEDAEDEEVQEERRKKWEARDRWGEVVIPTKSRRTKLLGFPDVTFTRLSDKTGKPLKPYVGPPLCEYTQGHAYTPIKRVQFNPKSRAHIRQRLIHKYGWKPSKFTASKDNPVPVVDDDVIRGLPYPEAQRLADYYLVTKRIGQLSDGKKAWMKAAREIEMTNGERRFRVHGRVNTNGAVTGRCTHMDPNLAQVPKNTAAFKLCPDYDEVQGYRCRDLFIAHPPYGLVGFDGSSLELRMLAHYVHPYDNGEYAEIVNSGNHADGTDPHSWMRTEIVGEDIIGAGEPGRDNSKTAMYAYLYGSGNENLGSIVLPTASVTEKRELGAEIKAKLETRFVALGRLKGAIEEAVEERGYLLGLDGRKLRVRKAHAALNTLLQSAGAIVMKKTLIVLDADLQAQGLRPGTDYEFVANVHDEAQAEVLPDRYPIYSEAAREAHPQAGRMLRVLCPLKAEVSPLAHSWKETH